MLILQKKSPHIYFHIISIFLIGTLTFKIWEYINRIKPFIVSRDQWRFLSLIERYYNNNLSWFDFFTTHSAHVKPGYLVSFLANGIFFNLNLRIEMLLGLIALFSLTLFIYKKTYDQSKPSLNPIYLIFS